MPKTLSPPATAPTTSITEREEHAKLYRVVLLDDDDHTYDYVIEMLMRLFLKSADEAYRNAVEVDTLGRTIVMTCEHEAAEFARDQIHGFGADWRLPRSKGSMSALIEPAEGSNG